ncbi:MAG TPA: choice-of-anchor D domain-containing protein, partial [Candidatus Cloacimonadota bacterium]|nr:choice-of-anchor D domain-containing protein [Candidatus Cloacimonadota bacterium]
TFPPTGVFYAPPQNLAASPSHQSVQLTWQAPASGSPTGYKIFKNSTLLTTVGTLSYMDYAVTNGTSYSYYLKAVYSGGESDATTTVAATPNAVAPTNLTATPGSNMVMLSWTAATGRGGDRSISSYRVYRNGSALNTTTGTTYQDNSVTTGTTYSYYVTTLYTDPTGESAASNTVNATPAALTEVIVGSGTSSTGTNAASPINVYYQSLHGQAVYTAAELNALDVFGPVNITELGFNITALPDKNMPNYVVRMKHTTAVNVSNWVNSDDLITVYSNPSYRPTVTGYNMYTLSTPFLWNGTDNILIDTAFGLIGSYSSTGSVQYTSLTNGYRYTRGDAVDQTDVFTGSGMDNTTSIYRPNVKLVLYPVQTEEPFILVTPNSIDFPETIVGGNDSRAITIHNSGSAPLIGTITTPDGFSISQRSGESLQMGSRNILPFEIAEESSMEFALSFNPTSAISYSGNVVIASNASNNDNVQIPVTGEGFIPPTIELSTTELEVGLLLGQETTQNFSISNLGSQDLHYKFGIQEINPGRVLRSESSERNITGSTLSLDAGDYTPGTTVNWEFSVYNGSSDQEWLKSVVISFPPGLVINSTGSFIGGSGGNMIPDVTTGNGVQITWYGESGGWGVVHGTETATASVNVIIPAGYSYPIILPYTIIGDNYNAEPHTLTGELELASTATLPAWFDAQPYYGTIAGSEQQEVVGAFSALGLEPGLYQAKISIYANDPEDPISQIDVSLTVGVPIEITVPSGAEAWLSGTEEDILWDYSGMGATVDLDYSIDGGATWLAIGTMPTSAGMNSYAWTIPYTPST